MDRKPLTLGQEDLQARITETIRRRKNGGKVIADHDACLISRRASGDVSPSKATASFKLMYDKHREGKSSEERLARVLAAPPEQEAPEEEPIPLSEVMQALSGISAAMAGPAPKRTPAPPPALASEAEDAHILAVADTQLDRWDSPKQTSPAPTMKLTHTRLTRWHARRREGDCDEEEFEHSTNSILRPTREEAEEPPPSPPVELRTIVKVTEPMALMCMRPSSVQCNLPRLVVVPSKLTMACDSRAMPSYSAILRSCGRGVSPRSRGATRVLAISTEARHVPCLGLRMCVAPYPCTTCWRGPR